MVVLWAVPRPVLVLLQVTFFGGLWDICPVLWKTLSTWLTSVFFIFNASIEHKDSIFRYRKCLT